jgi:hypothetical protein
MPLGGWPPGCWVVVEVIARRIEKRFLEVVLPKYYKPL